MSRSSGPLVSCIVTAFAEGPLAAVAIESLLAQRFSDFEILVVDDGATEETRATLHAFQDPRIRHLRQANDGLSSARNRALTAAQGDYVCFLDADDTRPGWAFDEMVRTALRTDADVVFQRGLLCELRNEVSPFYDDDVFARMQASGLGAGRRGDSRFAEGLTHLAAIEPQSANKLVRRALIDTYALRFPSGLFFEDLVFHNATIFSMASYATTELPCFTYHRRYGRPQITSGVGVTRFDAVSSAANTLELFSRSPYFQHSATRLVVTGATFKLLKWCEESTSHQLRWHFRQSLLALVARLDPRYAHFATGPDYAQALAIAPWIEPALDYYRSLISASDRRAGL